MGFKAHDTSAGHAMHTKDKAVQVNRHLQPPDASGHLFGLQKALAHAQPASPHASVRLAPP